MDIQGPSSEFWDSANPTLRNDPGSMDIYPAAVECNPDFQG